MLILGKLPACNGYISAPILWSDNWKATLTVNQLTNHLLEPNIDLVDNRNITNKNLSREALHLKNSG